MGEPPKGISHRNRLEEMVARILGEQEQDSDDEQDKQDSQPSFEERLARKLEELKRSTEAPELSQRKWAEESASRRAERPAGKNDEMKEQQENNHQNSMLLNNQDNEESFKERLVRRSREELKKVTEALKLSQRRWAEDEPASSRAEKPAGKNGEMKEQQVNDQQNSLCPYQPPQQTSDIKTLIFPIAASMRRNARKPCRKPRGQSNFVMIVLYKGEMIDQFPLNLPKGARV